MFVYLILEIGGPKMELWANYIWFATVHLLILSVQLH